MAATSQGPQQQGLLLTFGLTGKRFWLDSEVEGRTLLNFTRKLVKLNNLHCPKSNQNVLDITQIFEENEKLH